MAEGGEPQLFLRLNGIKDNLSTYAHMKG